MRNAENQNQDIKTVSQMAHRANKLGCVIGLDVFNAMRFALCLNL